MTLFGESYGVTARKQRAMYRIIGTDEKEYGPVSAEQLRHWLDEGRLSRRTPVKTDGGAEWKSLDALPEFRASLGEGPPVISRQSAGGTLNKIIPYRNGMALAAYYLAIFSLIPFVGIVLGLAGFVLGILGLKAARANPAVGGKVHAWIGIVVGGLFGFGYLALTVALVGAASK
jgi:hypothetical protein